MGKLICFEGLIVELTNEDKVVECLDLIIGIVLIITV